MTLLLNIMEHFQLYSFVFEKNLHFLFLIFRLRLLPQSPRGYRLASHIFIASPRLSPFKTLRIEQDVLWSSY